MTARCKSLTVVLESLEPRALFSVAVESIDGSGNNLLRPALGSAGTDLLRSAPAAYGDGISTPAGSGRPSARAVSNAISSQSADATNNRHLSDMIYLFGQFLDHDIDLTGTGTAESFNVAVPKGDVSFDPAGTGTKVISLKRSEFDPATGTSKANPRQQINDITSFIDGSQIYGSNATRAAALRTFAGGHLKTSAGNLLALNTVGLPNANDAHAVADTRLFLAGDVRANENIELTAMQTLFVREHNRLADTIATQHPTWTDEQIYQQSRSTVIAELQAITFNEFLPALLGQNAVQPYRGYNPKVNPSIANEFSTAAYRFGHSMLDGEIGRLNNDGTDIPQGSASLRNAFFNPTLLDTSLPNHQGDIDPLLKGAVSGNAQEIDVKVVDDVRNFLFGQPGQGGFDLVALNIQRGRDNGLADYNTVRAAYGLPKVTSFAQITSDPTLQASLKATYTTVDNIDLWVGGLAEDHATGSSVGQLFGRIIANQFQRLRDGDRFWFENALKGPALGAMEHTTLADVIQRNTSLTTLQKNVFFFGAPITPTSPGAPMRPIPPNPSGSPPSRMTGPKSNPLFTAHTAPNSMIREFPNVNDRRLLNLGTHVG